MARDYFDHPRVPVNRIAAIVLYNKGISFNPNNKIHQAHWEYPPSMIEFTGHLEHNMIGYRRGSLIVVGYFGPRKYRNRSVSRWVVKCSCGSYEVRTRKALLNEINVNDRCQQCKYLYKLTLGKEYKSKYKK